MESVMNFLADNYIYFFIAAGLLLFALIGFLIDSKKKKGKEFKGEAVSNMAPFENVTAPVETPMSSVNASAVEAPVAPVVNETLSTEPVVNTEVMQNVEVPTEPVMQETPMVEQTMEINDIPLAMNEEAIIEEKPVNPELQPVYSEPVNFEEPVQEPIANVMSAEEVMPKANTETPNEENLEIFEELN